MRSELRADSSAHSALHAQRLANGVPVLRFAALAGEPGLVHGISTRDGGVSHGPYATLNVSLVVGDEAERALAEAAGSDPADSWAGIGPAIGRCCYEVGDEDGAAVGAAGPRPERVTGPGSRGRPHLDLAAANRQQLEPAGLPPTHILDA